MVRVVYIDVNGYYSEVRLIVFATYTQSPELSLGLFWHNPYTVKKYGLEKVIEMYREYIINKPELLKLIPIELKDKTLGCWCKPKPCHGDVLAELADA